jgi:NlpC/P60 family
MRRSEFLRVFAAGLTGIVSLPLWLTGRAAAQSLDAAPDAGAPDADVSDADADAAFLNDLLAPDPLACGFAMLGLPYIWGGATGRSYFGPYPHGADCSGFCAYVAWVGYGVRLPAQTALAWRVTEPTDDPQRGDLVFYSMRSPNPRIQHMAIYLGDNQVIQSGGLRSNVNVASVYAMGPPAFRKMPTG